MADDLPRHKGGRPRTLGGDAMPVSAWVTKQEYDRLSQIATRRQESLSAVVRQILTRGSRRPSE